MLGKHLASWPVGLRWFVLTVSRLLIIGAIGLLLVQLLVWIPASHARRLVRQQLAFTAQLPSQLDSIAAELNGLPSLNHVKAQQIGSVKTYVDEVSQAASSLRRLQVGHTAPLHATRGISLTSGSHIIADSNQVVRSIGQLEPPINPQSTLQNASQLLAYHQAVMSALVNVLEYDPTTDTTGFSLGSSDSSHRLELAQNGLNKIGQQLAALPSYTDPTLGQVSRSISDLNAQLGQLRQTGDTKAWINAVTAAQTAIINNRVVFWQSQSSQLLNQLHGQAASSNAAHKLWWQLGSRYHLT